MAAVTDPPRRGAASINMTRANFPAAAAAATPAGPAPMTARSYRLSARVCGVIADVDDAEAGGDSVVVAEGDDTNALVMYTEADVVIPGVERDEGFAGWIGAVG